MISTSDFEKGMIIKTEGQLWMIVGFDFVSPGKGTAFYRTKLKNLATGNANEKTFKSGEKFEEVVAEKSTVKFLYAHRDSYFFCQEKDPSARFNLSKEVVGNSAAFLKPNQIVEALSLEGKIASISLPIKVNLKVTIAPPSFKGDTAQGGNKSVTLETGAQINVPMFVKEGDVIEVNTEKGEYTKRVE
jgi:elongation factor P